MLDGRFEILHPVRLDQIIDVNPFFGVVPRGHLAISHGRPRLKMDAAEGPFSWVPIIVVPTSCFTSHVAVAVGVVFKMFKMFPAWSREVCCCCPHIKFRCSNKRSCVNFCSQFPNVFLGIGLPDSPDSPDFWNPWNVAARDLSLERPRRRRRRYLRYTWTTTAVSARPSWPEYLEIRASCRTSSVVHGGFEASP